MLESRYRFRTLAFYIRTYHNITADWVSRESKEVVEKEARPASAKIMYSPSAPVRPNGMPPYISFTRPFIPIG